MWTDEFSATSGTGRPKNTQSLGFRGASPRTNTRCLPDTREVTGTRRFCARPASGLTTRARIADREGLHRRLEFHPRGVSTIRTFIGPVSRVHSIPMPPELITAPAGAGIETVHRGPATPALFAPTERAERRFWEFFTAHIRNRNTRLAYLTAARRLAKWCEPRNLALDQMQPMLVAAYIEELTGELSPASVKQHLAAIRMLFDWLVVGQVLPFNPARSVRGPKHVVKTGKTPVLSAHETRTLLDGIDTSTLAGLRDRALIAVLVYSFARISAAVALRVEDYYTQGPRSYFRLHEKGGRYNVIPAHHRAQEYVDAYLDAAQIRHDRRGPLFRSCENGRRAVLQRRAMSRNIAFYMIKRHAKKAGLPDEVCAHSFRATGITEYLRNGGSIEVAAQIAGHESTRTTQLYNRLRDEVSLDEIERIHI